MTPSQLPSMHLRNVSSDIQFEEPVFVLDSISSLKYLGKQYVVENSGSVFQNRADTYGIEL
jgi:hypothetical protein